MEQPDAPIIRARLSYRPFHIGSGSANDLYLHSKRIQLVHIRLFITTTGQVSLINLGEAGSVILGDVPLATFASTSWKPGVVLRLAEYELKLQTVFVNGEDSLLEVIQPPVITQENDAVAPELPEWLPDSGVFSEEVELKTLLKAQLKRPLPGQADEDSGPIQALVEAARAPQVPAPPAPEEEALPPAEATRALASDQTPEMPFHLEVSQAALNALTRTAGGYEAPADSPPLATLPKHWQTAQLFSAQLLVNPVALVAGERVRVPISVRNESAQPLTLDLQVRGLPAEWIKGPGGPLTVGPSRIGFFDVILQPDPLAGQAVQEAEVRLVSREDSAVTLTLPMRLQLKAEPNLIGRVEPEAAGEAGGAALTLQNCTQATIDVFMAGHCEAPALEVSLAERQVRIPPGQTVKVPILFRVLQRPWVGTEVIPFAVSAVHESRAPLDFVGTVAIAPRVRKPLGH